MTDQPTAKPDNASQHPKLFYALSILLIGNFLWRLFVPANEYPSNTARIMEMVFDAGMLAGLIGIRKSGPQALFVIALIAGIGLFGIRMHSKHSWYTGHWNYSLERR